MKKAVILALSLILPKMRRTSFNSESGVVLPVIIVLGFAVTVTGIAFLNSGVMENRAASREITKNEAFYLAEAGLERTLWNLEQDFEVGGDDWTDGDINGVSVGEPDGGSWRVLGYDESSLQLGAGSYRVKLKYVDEDEIWLRSTGTVENVTKTTQLYAKILNVSVWNNAIFGGSNQVGQVISGNVRIRGKVHVLGENLGSEDLAVDLTGTAGIWNNYEGMPEALAAKIPPCPQTSFNGEMIDSLDTVLRVKQGKVSLSGTATVGQPDEVGNLLKETDDAVYVTDGFGGEQGAGNVYSDNGTTHPYDLGDMVSFPSLTDEHPGYFSFLDYLQSNSRHIPVSEISSTVDSFEYGDPTDTNYISWDKENNLLTIKGIIYIEGGSLDLGIKHETVEYRGKGTIVAASSGVSGIAGDIRIHGNLLAEGTYADNEGFPNNVLGLVSGSLYLAAVEGESQVSMNGAFFAENQIMSAKQNEIAGTFVSNYFNMGQDVPRIYQVPDLAKNLPPGIPQGTPIWYITTGQWSELPS